MIIIWVLEEEEVQEDDEEIQEANSTQVQPEEYGGHPAHTRLNLDQVPFDLDNQPQKVYVPAQTSEHAQILLTFSFLNIVCLAP